MTFCEKREKILMNALKYDLIMRGLVDGRSIR
jgi:hypothetical protein